MSIRLPRTPPRRRAALAAGLLTIAVALAVTGCVRIDADLSVDGDTISGTLLTAINQQAAEQLELDPDDVFAAPAEDFATLDGVTDAPYDDGTWAGTEYTFDRVLLDDLNQLADQNPEALRIARNNEAGTYELSMVMDLAWLADIDDEDLADPDAPDLAELLDRFEVTIAVTFPDEVSEHNGELTGSTVTWRPPPGERTELRAVAVDPDPAAGGAPADPGQDRPDTGAGQGDEDASAAGTGSDGPGVLALVLLVGLAVLVLAATGLGLSWLVRSRQSATAPLTEALADFVPAPAATPSEATSPAAAPADAPPPDSTPPTSDTTAPTSDDSPPSSDDSPPAVRRDEP